MRGRPNEQGFTLTELAIVMVIIGLCAAGIVTGQYLMRAHEIRKITEELGTYASAVDLFVDKYRCLPGDCKKATQWWPTAENGDGDWQLETDPGDDDSFDAWQQLQLANLIKGSYTGMPGPAGAQHAVPGVNVPAGPLTDTGYTLFTISNVMYYAGNAFYFPGHYGLFLEFGRYPGMTTDDYTRLGAITPEEAQQLDMKIDGDGKPATGRIRTGKGGNAYTPGCTTTDVVATAEYDLTNNRRACNLLYLFRD